MRLSGETVFLQVGPRVSPDRRTDKWVRLPGETVSLDRTSASPDGRTDKWVRLSGETVFLRVGPLFHQTGALINGCARPVNQCFSG